jgi:hypothetical protein
MKKTVLKAIISLSVAVVAVQASAYDVDTHFYGTYAMARFAGIRHEVANKIALGAQWMDESYLSDPTSMIVNVEIGLKKRRLLHFPGSRLANKMTADTLDVRSGLVVEPTTGQPLRALTETEADHPFATEMFTEGLMEGNLMKAAAGLHTLEDSFAHAGNFSEIGHANLWHHPDRPFADEQSIEKYFKMTRSVLKALVAIRTLLPASAIDTSVQFSSNAPNYKLDGDQLADLYAANPIVRHTVARNILNDPEYVKYAVAYAFQKALKADYVKPGYEPYINVNSGEDTYTAVTRIALALPKGIINANKVLADTGYSQDLSAEYVESMGGADALIAQVVRDLIVDFVPRPMTVYHRIEKEEDGPLREKEMSLRETNVRGMIWALYKTDIFFVKNNTSDARGLVKELRGEASANPVLPVLPKGSATELVTYSLEEKRAFDEAIFSFLFPKTAKAININLIGDLIAAGDIETFSDNGKLADFVKDKAVAALSWGKALIDGGSLKQNFVTLVKEDLLGAHIRPNPLNKFYAYPSLVQKKLADGTFKKLLSETQASQLLAKQ